MVLDKTEMDRCCKKVCEEYNKESTKNSKVLNSESFYESSSNNEEQQSAVIGRNRGRRASPDKN